MDSLESIKKQMTDAFMADSNVQALYGFASGASWEDTFAGVSIENIIFYIVAYVIWLRETAFASWSDDVQQTALATRYGTKQWWHAKALEWQKGDELIVSDSGEISYALTDTTKQVVKYCAVVEDGRSIYLRVAKGSIGALQSLSQTTEDNELAQFSQYCALIKPVGMTVIAQSMEAVNIGISAKIYYDAQKSKTEIEETVKTAINTYLNTIEFGGVIFTQKIVDCIMATNGVKDCWAVKLLGADSSTELGRNYRGQSGYYAVNTWNINMEAESNLN